MAFLKSCRKLFTRHNELYYAVEDNNISKLTALYDLGLSINSYYLNCTILQHSLSFRTYECTCWLLEHGADPDLPYLLNADTINHAAPRGKTLQPYLRIWVPETDAWYFFIKERNESIIRLLALYGATEDELIFCPGSYARDFRQAFQLGHQLAVEKLHLETKLQQWEKQSKSALSETELAEARTICLQLQNLWLRLKREETRITLRLSKAAHLEISHKEHLRAFSEHYERKANFYEKQAESFLPTSCLKSAPPTSSSPLKQELTLPSQPKRCVR
jgi:hypothetical protein